MFHLKGSRKTYSVVQLQRCALVGALPIYVDRFCRPPRGFLHSNMLVMVFRGFSISMLPHSIMQVNNILNPNKSMT